MLLPKLHPGVVCSYGELVEDLVAVVDGMLMTNSQVPGRFGSRAGGAGPNTAVATARDGIAARFIGHVGDDQRSTELLRRVGDAGVDVVSLGSGRHATALALQLLSGETCLVFDAGARDTVHPDEMDKTLLDNASVLHLSSFNLYDAGTRAAFERMAALAQELAVPITLDASVSNQLLDFGVIEYRKVVADLQPAVLFCNEQEADVLEVERHYPAGARIVVCHRGPISAMALNADGERVEVPVANVSSTFESVGAGDAFAGGFLSAWSRGDDVSAALVNGHDAASRRMLDFEAFVNPLKN